jgi:hypothetical protein
VTQLAFDFLARTPAPRTISREIRLRPCDLRGQQRTHFDNLMRFYCGYSNPDAEFVHLKMRIFTTPDGPYVRLPRSPAHDTSRPGGDYFLGAP